jgi:hypothetical protein
MPISCVRSGTLKVLPLGFGHSYILRADAGKIILDTYELLRLWVRQGLQQCGTDDAENRRCGSDA